MNSWQLFSPSFVQTVYNVYMVHKMFFFFSYTIATFKFVDLNWICGGGGSQQLLSHNQTVIIGSFITLRNIFWGGRVNSGPVGGWKYVSGKIPIWGSFLTTRWGWTTFNRKILQVKKPKTATLPPLECHLFYLFGFILWNPSCQWLIYLTEPLLLYAIQCLWLDN